MCLVDNIIRMNLSDMKEFESNKRYSVQIETKRLTNLMYSDQVNQSHLLWATHK